LKAFTLVARDFQGDFMRGLHGAHSLRQPLRLRAAIDP
jgi:hypothetical protein